MPCDRQPRPARTPLIGVLAALAAVAVAAFDAHYRFFDMVIYHDAIRWWLDGGDLYEYAAPVRGRLGFTYPPVAAVLLMPVAAMPAVTAGWLNAGLGMVALTAVLAVLLAPAIRRHRRSGPAVLGVALVLALVTEPVRQTLGLGQVNLVLFALVVLDLTVLRSAGSRWAGAGVGVAAAIKLTPALFVVHLVLTGQWRTARTAIVTAAALTTAGFVLAPAETVRYFGDLLWRTDRVGAVDAVANQSLAGLLARWDATATLPVGGWTVLSLAMLAVGLWRARLAHATGDPITALTLVGLTGNLISPVSWTHHLVFLPVAVLVLADAGLRHRRLRYVAAALAVYAVAVVSPIWFAPDHPALGNAFTLTIVLLVLLLPVTAGDDAHQPGVFGVPASPRQASRSIMVQPAATRAATVHSSTVTVPARGPGSQSARSSGAATA